MNKFITAAFSAALLTSAAPVAFADDATRAGADASVEANGTQFGVDAAAGAATPGTVETTQSDTNAGIASAVNADVDAAINGVTSADDVEVVAQTGGKAIWAWPLAFVSVMLIGGGLGIAGFALPMVEPGILASIVVLGLLVGFAVKVPTAAGAALIGAFALLHGHAHGTELAGGTALTYAAGFAIATMALHLAGLGAGLLTQRRFAGVALRLAGAVTAALGLGLAFAV